MSIYAVNGKEPVAAWIPSRDTSGNGTTTLTDLVGSNNGTLTNMDAATDWVADTDNGGVRALDLDGSDDYVVSAFSGILANNARSVSLWVKASGVGAFISWGTNSAAQRWSVGLGTGNFGQPLGGVMVAINASFVANGTDIRDTNWHHIVAVYPSSGLLSSTVLYIDGLPVSITDSLNSAVSLNTVSGQPVTIGREASLSNYSNALIDDIRVFDSAIDASDVAYLYHSGNGRGRTTTYDSDAQAYFDAVEAVSSFDGTALETWLTPTYVKDHINAFVVGLKSDGVWSAIEDSALFIGPNDIAGAFVKLKGTSNVTIALGSFSHNQKTGVENAASSGLTTNQTTTATNNDTHLYVYLSNGYPNGTGRLISSSAVSMIIGSNSNIVRVRANSTTLNSPVSSVFSDGGAGWSRNNSADYDYLFGENTGTFSQVSSSVSRFDTLLFRQATSGLNSGTQAAFYSVGTAINLSLLNARVAALKLALNTETPIGGSTPTQRRRQSQQSILGAF